LDGFPTGTEGSCGVAALGTEGNVTGGDGSIEAAEGSVEAAEGSVEAAEGSVESGRTSWEAGCGLLPEVAGIEARLANSSSSP